MAHSSPAKKNPLSDLEQVWITIVKEKKRMPDPKYEGPYETAEDEEAAYSRYKRLRERERVEREEAEKKAREELAAKKKKNSLFGF